MNPVRIKSLTACSGWKLRGVVCQRTPGDTSLLGSGGSDPRSDDVGWFSQNRGYCSDGREGVLESACVGVPDEQSGEVKVFVVAKSRANLSAEGIRKHYRERLAAYKVPKYGEFLDSLPKSRARSRAGNCVGGDRPDPGFQRRKSG